MLTCVDVHFKAEDGTSVFGSDLEEEDAEDNDEDGSNDDHDGASSGGDLIERHKHHIQLAQCEQLPNKHTSALGLIKNWQPRKEK